MRRHVAWALGEIGTDEAWDALGKRLEIEVDVEVRGEIQEAIRGSAEKSRATANLA